MYADAALRGSVPWRPRSANLYSLRAKGMRLPLCRRLGGLCGFSMRDLPCPARASAGQLLCGCLVGVVVSSGVARADWRDPIAGAMPIRPARFETRETPLTVHARLPQDLPQPTSADGVPDTRWSLPLVDRRLDARTRAVPLAPALLEAINRIEPIYDPTLLEGPLDIMPMRISAGTAEMRDVFADHWRVASADANVDTDANPIAFAWTASASPRPCPAYRVRRRHAWREPALSAPSATDCRAIATWQARGYAEAIPLALATASPPLPIFAAPEPGSRMSSTDFWAARRAQIAGIHDHFQRKWAYKGRSRLRASLN